MTKIREDEHGVYVRTGGYLFRPQRTDRYRHYDDAVGFPVTTEVKARHLGGTGLAKVDDQVWFSHGGMYMGRASTELWEVLIPIVVTEEARAAVRAIFKPLKIINNVKIIDKGN